jgi:RNA polymerase sigma-70 factor, ECF subfamily
VSFGEPIALRMEAELERAADAAASAEVRFVPSAEEQFLERLRAGEAMAFNRLVEERHGDIYALLYRLTEDPEEARDLTQETFLQAFRHLASFRGDADLRTWLYRIAVNQARNRMRWWRRRRRGQQVALDDHVRAHGELPSDSVDASPERVLRQREVATRIWEALEALPFDQKTAIVLREIDGLSYDEIAFSLGVAVGTVKSRLARARETLRARLRGI